MMKYIIFLVLFLFGMYCASGTITTSVSMGTELHSSSMSAKFDGPNANGHLEAMLTPGGVSWSQDFDVGPMSSASLGATVKNTNGYINNEMKIETGADGFGRAGNTGVSKNDYIAMVSFLETIGADTAELHEVANFDDKYFAINLAATYDSVFSASVRASNS